jgi:multidrug efflux pump subunit AcrA (membrane-fusion protein)
VDRVIAKKKWSSKRILTIAGIAGIALLIFFSIYFTSGKSRLNVNTERITISEVKKGPFQETIPVNGIVLPQTTIFLDAQEGGRMEEKYVEDGAIMKQGQPILRLSNPDLELSLANQETSVFNVLTQMQIARNNAQQNTVTRLNQMADVDNALKEAERKYKLNKELYKKKSDRVAGVPAVAERIQLPGAPQKADRTDHEAGLGHQQDTGGATGTVVPKHEKSAGADEAQSGRPGGARADRRPAYFVRCGNWSEHCAFYTPGTDRRAGRF